MAMGDDATVRIGVDDSRYQKGMDRIERRMSRAEQVSRQMGDRIGSAFGIGGLTKFGGALALTQIAARGLSNAFDELRREGHESVGSMTALAEDWHYAWREAAKGVGDAFNWVSKQIHGTDNAQMMLTKRAQEQAAALEALNRSLEIRGLQSTNPLRAKLMQADDARAAILSDPKLLGIQETLKNPNLDPVERARLQADESATRNSAEAIRTNMINEAWRDEAKSIIQAQEQAEAGIAKAAAGAAGDEERARGRMQRRQAVGIELADKYLASVTGAGKEIAEGLRLELDLRREILSIQNDSALSEFEKKAAIGELQDIYAMRRANLDERDIPTMTRSLQAGVGSSGVRAQVFGGSGAIKEKDAATTAKATTEMNAKMSRLIDAVQNASGSATFAP